MNQLQVVYQAKESILKMYREKFLNNPKINTNLSEKEREKIDNINYSDYINVAECFVLCFNKIINNKNVEMYEYLNIIKPLDELNNLVSCYKISKIGKNVYLNDIKDLIDTYHKDVMFVINLFNQSGDELPF